jgi:hypothetical protein
MRIQRAKLADYNTRVVDLLKRWQEHRVPCGDVDAIAGPQPDSMAALLGYKAEAIPLGLEDPLLIVEGFVDEWPAANAPRDATANQFASKPPDGERAPDIIDRCTEYAERDAPANEEEQHGRLHAVDRLLVDVKLVSEVGHINSPCIVLPAPFRHQVNTL